MYRIGRSVVPTSPICSPQNSAARTPVNANTSTAATSRVGHAELADGGGVAAASNIETSIITNFTLNDFFTFPDRRTNGGRQFVCRLGKFNLVSLAGLAVNMAVLWTLTSIFGVYYLLSNLCGIAAATLWNYVVNSWWTWK